MGLDREWLRPNLHLAFADLPKIPPAEASGRGRMVKLGLPNVAHPLNVRFRSTK